MSRLALLAALLALAPLPIAFQTTQLRLTATPVPLDRADPAHVVVGRLRYLGGWVLTATDRRFGGISSMTLQDGRFVMLSDTAMVTTMRFDGVHPPAEVSIHPLPGGPGDGSRRSDHDSESCTYDSASGHVWAGFETNNEIWRYTKGFAAADGHAHPAAMADWPGNKGAEAMVRLHDGRFLVFAETKTNDDGSHVALLFPGDPTQGSVPIEFGYRGPAADFAPTDAAELPDGRVIVLHRSFSVLGGFASAVTVIDPRQIQAGKDIDGIKLAGLAPPLTVDNMEALAVEQRGKRTIMWIASDDNFFVAQRTLLLAFELPAGF